MNDTLKLKIESYIGNSMSKEDISLFEKEIVKNTSLKKEVELAKELNHFLSDNYIDIKPKNKKLAKEIKTYLQSDDAKKIETTLLKVKNEYHTENLKPKKKNYYLLIASIAVLFISVFSFYIINQKSSSDLFAQYYSINDLPSITKRGKDLNNLKNGVQEFENANYTEALKLFKLYTGKNNDINPSIYLYAGIANMELKQFHKAILEFDKMINSNTLDKSKGYWFKALLYLKMDEIEKSKKILRKIINKKLYNFEKASLLLEDLI